MAVQKVRPLGDRVLVLPAKAADRTPGGIHLPDTAKQKPQRGEGLAVGPERTEISGERVNMQVKPGDVVLFGPWAGQKADELGEAILVSEAEILAVLEK